MATELRLIRTLRGLEAADDESREAIKAWKIGQPLKCEVRIARDNSRLRWYWALCGVILDNTDNVFDNKEAVSDSIKFGIDHVSQVQIYDEEKGWRIERTPKSISFAKLSEPEFMDFLKRAEHYACTALGVSSDELADALTEFVAPGFRK